MSGERAHSTGGRGERSGHDEATRERGEPTRERGEPTGKRDEPAGGRGAPTGTRDERTGRRMVPERGPVASAIRRVYDATVRKHLPRKLGLYNGVVSRTPRLLDATDHLPGYKAELVAAIRRSVHAGDGVVVVGGGTGAASVIAAEEAGDEGRVVTFEAAGDRAAVVHEALRLNDVAGRVEHAVVATPGVVRGSASARRVAVTDLPAHDVLVLDCDGAELAILAALSDREDRPTRVVVETHGELGCPTGEVRAALEAGGYAVLSEEPKPGGEPGNAIVAAERDQSSSRASTSRSAASSSAR